MKCAYHNDTTMNRVDCGRDPDYRITFPAQMIQILVCGEAAQIYLNSMVEGDQLVFKKLRD